MALLEGQDRTREPDLVPVRHGRMMFSPFTFYRGAATIMAADLKDTPVAGLAIGLWIGAAAFLAFPISGGSLNPARTLGPDIVANDYTGWWIYILGPVLGALIAVAIIGLVRGLPDKQEREAAQGGALPMQDTPTPTVPQQETA